MQRKRQEYAATLTPEEPTGMRERRSAALAAMTPEQVEAMQAQRARYLPPTG